MSDISKELAVFVILEVPDGPLDRLTSHWTPATFEGNTYTVQAALEVSPTKRETGIGSTEGIIDGLEATTALLAGISAHLPYVSITATVFYAEVDPDTNIATNPVYIYKGLVYQAHPKIFTSKLSLECREGKFFTDITAGIACTEQCYAPVFGDAKICQKNVTERLFTVDSVSGNTLTVIDTVTDSNLTFNKGYLLLEGVEISIKYWKSGSTFQTITPPPSSWVGKLISVFYGCDRSKSSCINIHNNQGRFLGTGYGMMDYDPKYSTS